MGGSFSRRGEPPGQPRRRQPQLRRQVPLQGRSPAPVRGRVQPPLPAYSRRRDPIGRDASLPLVARLFLVLALLLLGGSVVLLGTGLLSGAVAGVGSTLSDVVGGITGGNATPSPTPAPTPQAPHLVQPVDGWTQQPAWDVHGYAPANLVGQSGYSVRIYVNGSPAATEPLGSTENFTVNAVPIPLGRSSITAAIVGPGGEGPQSQPISVVFDNVPPAIIMSGPTANATINGESVTVSGRTQGGSTVAVHNANTGLTATAVAKDGTFAIDVRLGNGVNPLTITATDPAGNVSTKQLSVVKGNGATAVRLRISFARIKLSDLPHAFSAYVTATDPDGAPIAGATVNFALTVPGLQPVSFDATTGADGKASWTTTLPRDGVVAGNALVVALVTLPNDPKAYREVSSFVVLQ